MLPETVVHDNRQMGSSMRREYDIFEKFPDGYAIWRASVRGQFEAKRKAQELAEFSDNEFVAVDSQGEKLLLSGSAGSRSRLLSKGMANIYPIQMVEAPRRSRIRNPRSPS
jgi:hypothetical protein